MFADRGAEELVKSQFMSEPNFINAKVQEPFDFRLYSEIFSLSRYRLPYEYSETYWRSVLQTEDGSLFPVEVTPCSNENCGVLRIAIFRDGDTADYRFIRRVIQSVFCAKVAIELNQSNYGKPLRPVISRFQGLKPHLSQDPYQSLIKIIIRQLIGAEHAKTLITNFSMRLGKKIRIGERSFYSFPGPETVAAASKQDLLSIGVGYKWKYIKSISREVCEGNLTFGDLQDAPDDEVTEILEQYDGIGDWSSEVFLFDGLHRLHTYPFGDITIQRAVKSLDARYASLDDSADWDSLSIRNFAGMFATYLFAYFREMRRIGQLEC